MRFSVFSKKGDFEINFVAWLLWFLVGLVIAFGALAIIRKVSGGTLSGALRGLFGG